MNRVALTELFEEVLGQYVRAEVTMIREWSAYESADQYKLEQKVEQYRERFRNAMESE